MVRLQTPLLGQPRIQKTVTKQGKNPKFVWYTYITDEWRNAGRYGTSQLMVRQTLKSSKSPKTKRATSSRNSTKVRRSLRSPQRSKRLSSQPIKSTKSVLKKKMSPRSAKAKGRKLQNWVVEKLLDTFKGLTNLDIRSTPMGVNGVDVQFSTAAYKKFPYDIECKNTERMTTNCIIITNRL